MWVWSQDFGWTFIFVHDCSGIHNNIYMWQLINSLRSCLGKCIFLPSSFSCLSSFSCGRDHRLSFSSSSWGQSLMAFLWHWKEAGQWPENIYFTFLTLSTCTVHVIPCGSGSCGRWCLCLCLLFFFGGCMCISLYCSGSWGEKNMITCI